MKPTYDGKLVLLSAYEVLSKVVRTRIQHEVPQYLDARAQPF